VTEAVSFLVRKDDLSTVRFDPARLGARDGEILVQVERFGFTANNVTYAQLGDSLRYWQFWPAAEGWGAVPVWGFGDVVESRHPGIRAGERLYGFWPMATHAILQPGRVGADLFLDGSPHRRELPAVYNLYARVAAEPGHDARHEDLEALLRPLFGTSFLLDDFLRENGFFGAKRTLLLSASGKTAFGLAHLLRSEAGTEVAGLSSRATAAFVAGLGCYDRVETYDGIGALPVEPSLYVDFAGSSTVREAIHARLGDALKYACAVGISHGEAKPKGQGLAGPKPVFFFAPEYGRKRAEVLGRDEYARRYRLAWQGFLPLAARAVRVVRESGREALERVYREALAGRVPPERGNILSLQG
jgi:hypothetical protein